MRFSTAEPSAQRPPCTPQFTSKERDAETGLDFFLARYYSGAQGRFTSPDPDNAGALEDDPQSWNGYAYGRNNPLKYTDPTGLAYQLCTPGGGCIYDYSDADFYFNFQSDPSITLSGGTIWAGGKVIGYYSQLSEDSWFKRYQDTLAGAKDYLERRSQYQLSQGNYLAYAIDKVGKFVAPSNNIEAALLFVGGSLEGLTGKTLLKAAAKQGMTAEKFISLFRKASVSNVFPGKYLQKALTEVIADAKQGIAEAQTALKLLTDNRFKK